MNNTRKISILIGFFLFTLFYSQTDKKDSLIASFTYLVKAKLYKSTPDKIYEELFSLQVLKDRAFFISEQSMKYDSTFQSEFQKATVGGTTHIDFRGKSFPKTRFPYTVLQTNQNNQYFERAGMSLLSYKETVINNWKLVDESKTIQSFNCRKAEVNYNGRNWTAWYTTDIPLAYGPYKFTGLPGLIIKISDQSGDYDFELVKSIPNSQLKGKMLAIEKRRYENASATTMTGLREAKKNSVNNMVGALQSMETTILPESRETVRDIQLQKQKNLNDENTIERIQ
ncbi:GLPGLI family protein [Elizabethkingia bruuniana]|uniref:GLPGLI family protein n=1 Tax=Elizabethkingia bruuniana TaxID=1756149 RepID=UPI0009CAEA68|nr:GLPGLI family protein [Elizabethkingia bruuniana]OPC56801.1 hypothetical protein BAY07_07360 [Elizabethkingia bruuniana]